MARAIPGLIPRLLRLGYGFTCNYLSWWQGEGGFIDEGVALPQLLEWLRSGAIQGVEDKHIICC